MRPARSGAGVLILLTAALMGGCADGLDTADAPIPTIPDAPAPPVPTLAEGPSSPAPTTGTTPPAPATADATPPPAPAAPPAPPAPPPTPAPVAPQPVDEQDPVELGRSLGVGGMAELLAENPDLAGQRGPELLRDLQRIAEQPDARQIETVFGRIPGWIEDGQLDERIGIAAQAALEQAFQQVQDQNQGDGEDGEGDDDD